MTMRPRKPIYKKHEVCDDCTVDWDRKGGVKRIVLCDLHAAAPDLLAACQGALAMLQTMTSKEFGLGGDKTIRLRLEHEIDRATGLTP